MRKAGITVEFLRYVIAGGLAFSVDVGIFQFALRVLHLGASKAAILGYAAGLCVVYLASIQWVFSYRRVQKRGREFMLFATIGLVGLATNMLAIELLAVRYKQDPLLAKLAATAMTFGFNFLIRKWMLFSRHST